MPQLSVIVTSYNIEQYIEQCLDSVVGQTLEDIEIIVVDDGSTDRTPQIIDQYAEKDSRIIPVLLPDNTPGGVATAANAGLDRATGYYVGFADGDDFLELDMFEKLLLAADSYDSDLAMCKYKLFDDETGELSDPAEVSRWTEIVDADYELEVEVQKTFLRFIAVPWRKIYRRDMLERESIRFPVGDYFYEDNPFHWFSVLSATSIAVVPEVLCYHRVARAGQTISTADERLFRIFIHHDTIRTWLAERGYLAEFAPTLLAWAISQMEWIAPRTPPALRRPLFDILAGVISAYDNATIDVALFEGRKGQRARSLCDALATGNFAAFNRALDDRATSSNPLVSAVYHLRYSGLSHTAKLTKRYATNAVERSRVGLPRTRRSRSEVSNRDLMFVLIALQRRIEALDARVNGMVTGSDED